MQGSNSGQQDDSPRAITKAAVIGILAGALTGWGIVVAGRAYHVELGRAVQREIGCPNIAGHDNTATITDVRTGKTRCEYRRSRMVPL